MARQSQDWPAIRLEFINGSMLLAELAVKHGINHSTMRSRAMREGWQADRDATQQAATHAAQQSLGEERAALLAEQNQVDLSLARAIHQRAAEMLAAGVALGEDGEMSGLTPRDLNAIAKAAESAQKIGRLALGVSTDNLGHGGPNGQGPVPVTAIPPGEYAEALRQALAAF